MEDIFIRVIPAQSCGCGTAGCCSEGDDTEPLQEGANAVACAGGYDLSAIVACATATGSLTPTTYSETKENPDA